MTSLSTFNSKNLRTKEDTKNYFSKSTQKIDLIYLPQKSKHLKAIFNSTDYFIKHGTNRNVFLLILTFSF